MKHTRVVQGWLVGPTRDASGRVCMDSWQNLVSAVLLKLSCGLQCHVRLTWNQGFRRAILEIDSASLVSASRGRAGTATQNPLFIEFLHLPKLVWEVN